MVLQSVLLGFLTLPRSLPTGLSSFLASSPSCSHSEYTSAALDHLSSRLSQLPAPARRAVLTALAGRLACGDRPRGVRLAAAALTAAALRRDGDGALEVLRPLQALIQEGKVGVVEGLWRMGGGGGRSGSMMRRI